MKPFSPDDIYRHRTLQDLSTSAQHDHVVFVRSRASRKNDNYISTAWQVDTATDARRPRQLTAATSSARSLLLDATGERMAFLSQRDANKGQQAHLIALDGGEARAITDERDEIKGLLAWSHDGRRLLATQKVKWAEDEHDDVDAKNRPLVVRHLPYKLDGTGPKVGHRTRLVEIDVDSGKVSVLLEGDFDVSEAQWSPDGTRLAISRKRGGQQRHQADLWLADGDGGNARQVTDDLYSVGGLAFSPDGRTLAFGAGHIEGDSIVNLYFYDLDSGARRDPGEDALQLEGSTIVWHPDGRRVATIGSRKGLFEVTVVNLNDGSTQALGRGLRQVTALAASGDGLVFVAASVRRPEELYRIGWDGAGERRLTSFNRGWTSKRTRPRARKRSFRVPDAKGGTETIEAWLLLPDGAGPFPMLVDFHGGPQSVALIDFASHAYWYALVSKGWAILAPNPVGSGGYGDEFARRLTGHWGEYDLPQVEAILRQLQKEGIADERLACYGKSYGGYLSAWTAANSEMFKAAIVSAPVTNIQSHGGTSDTGYYVTPYAMGAELYENSEVFARLSPVEHAVKVDTATLFLQGQDDQRCPLGQSEEMYANLVRAGCRRTMMVVYPGGSHSLAGTGTPSHRADYHGRIVRWVEQHV